MNSHVRSEELQERNAAINDTTKAAVNSTMLNPRFYTTDFDELDRVDVSAVRGEWDVLIEELKSDPNRGHFKRNADWDKIDLNALPEGLRKEFIDFLVSSLTAEFSGCVLYKEMKRRGSNPDICELFGYMSRDESRHAGFINDALKEFDIAVNMGFLAKAKKYTYFKPKFIYYATYLSEKIGYARYITIFRHLERNPQNRFHPIFKWFEKWCNDEFRHGEAFALLMRANPSLVSGMNVWWCRFFQLAVFATMYVRDHARPEFHKALGMTPTDYDMRVFRITEQICRQVFPATLDIDHPGFLRDMEKLRVLGESIAAAKAQGGMAGGVKRAGLTVAAGVTFLRALLRRPRRHELPADARLAPAW